jgi:hypothetical protein
MIRTRRIQARPGAFPADAADGFRFSASAHREMALASSRGRQVSPGG